MNNATPITCQTCAGERGYFHEGITDDYWKVCPVCDGTGEQPWRPAGKRYTGPKAAVVFAGPLFQFEGDVLEVLKVARTAWNRKFYTMMRKRAMQPKRAELNLAEMLARMTMVENAMDRALQAWRKA